MFFVILTSFLCTCSTNSNFAVLEIGNWRNFQFLRSFQIYPIENVISIFYNICLVIPICLFILYILHFTLSIYFLYIFLNFSLINDKIRFEAIISILAFIQLSTVTENVWNTPKLLLFLVEYWFHAHRVVGMSNFPP